MEQPNSRDSECIDDRYGLLANRHRRAVLAYFQESASDVASVSDIATEISDHGGEEQARIQLHHYALPRLDAAGVVEYDTRSNTVRYRGHPNLECPETSLGRR